MVYHGILIKVGRCMDWRIVGGGGVTVGGNDIDRYGGAYLGGVE